MITFLLIAGIIAVIIAASSNAKRRKNLRMQYDQEQRSRSFQTEVESSRSLSGYRLRDFVEPRTALPANTWTPIEWYGEGSSLLVGSYRIEAPLVYSSAGHPKLDDASCINRTLPVGEVVSEPRGSLGYWPTYERISPHQRANYLHWLQSGKKEDTTDVGYVFLYFYGLERRALLEKQDHAAVLHELVRLTDKYGASGSLLGYSASFAAYLSADSANRGIVSPMESQLISLDRRCFNTDLLAVLLYLRFEDGQPLTSDFAQLMAAMDPTVGRSVVPIRFPEEFSQLFATKYRLRHGDGIELKAAKRMRLIEHRFASGTLGREMGIDKVEARIPDVLGISSQFSDLVEIYNLCVEELRPLSRKVGAGHSVNSREAFAALPKELREEADHPDEPKWRAIAEANQSDDGFALVEISKLAALLEIEQREKLTLKQTREIAETAQHVGYVIEPDGRILNTSYEWEDLVALFRDDETLERATEPSFVAACLVLQLGLWVAASDGKADPEELKVLSAFIEEIFKLAPHECKRLEIQRRVLLIRPADQLRLGKRIQEALSFEQRKRLGELLVAVALATHGVDESEWRALRKAYRALGLNPEVLDSTIESLVPQSDRLATVRPAKPGITGEPIPPKTAIPVGPAVQLNAAKLREILDNTREVTAILAEVFAVDETALAIEDKPQVVQTITRFRGLQERYHLVLEELARKEHWSDTEFNALIARHSMMRPDVIEKVNLWSDEYLGDFLVSEAEGHIRIHKHLLESGE